jgi:hypothetical protein
VGPILMIEASKTRFKRLIVKISAFDMFLCASAALLYESVRKDIAHRQKHYENPKAALALRQLRRRICPLGHSRVPLCWC